MPFLSHSSFRCIFLYLQHTVKPGDGANTPKEGDKITIHYSVALANQGTKHLESTREGLNPRPLKFVVGDGKVVPGVEKAVQKMTLGEKALVTVPPEEGYGSQGKGW